MRNRTRREEREKQGEVGERGDARQHMGGSTPGVPRRPALPSGGHRQMRWTAGRQASSISNSATSRYAKRQPTDGQASSRTCSKQGRGVGAGGSRMKDESGQRGCQREGRRGGVPLGAGESARSDATPRAAASTPWERHVPARGALPDPLVAQAPR
ncbi:unnamed protein product, partial [Prorocentrum cordatum]